MVMEELRDIDVDEWDDNGLVSRANSSESDKARRRHAILKCEPELGDVEGRCKAV